MRMKYKGHILDVEARRVFDGELTVVNGVIGSITPCDDVESEDGSKYSKRVFEVARSQRLHWINHHIKEKTPLNIDVFTVEERDSKKRKVKKTYIYDTVEKYVIVLEQQRAEAFYLLTAYHLNKEYGKRLF